MADEITVSSVFKVQKGNLKLDLSRTQRTITMSGDDESVNTQPVATTAAGDAITIASAVTAKGMTVFENLDLLDSIDIGPRDGSGNFIPFVTLLPGEFAGSLRLKSSVTPYAKASANTPRLFSAVIEA